MAFKSLTPNRPNGQNSDFHRRRSHERTIMLAGQAVRRAVKTGKLPQVHTLICSDCQQNQAKEYHHHKGYERENWLDVIPLCVPCHGKTRRTPEQEKPIFRKHQCEALSKKGVRCPVWAMKDSPYCGAHTLQSKILIHYTEATP